MSWVHLRICNPKLGYDPHHASLLKQYDLDETSLLSSHTCSSTWYQLENGLSRLSPIPLFPNAVTSLHASVLFCSASVNKGFFAAAHPSSPAGSSLLIVHVLWDDPVASWNQLQTMKASQEPYILVVIHGLPDLVLSLTLPVSFFQMMVSTAQRLALSFLAIFSNWVSLFSQSHPWWSLFYC